MKAYEYLTEKEQIEAYTPAARVTTRRGQQFRNPRKWRVRKEKIQIENL